MLSTTIIMSSNIPHHTTIIFPHQQSTEASCIIMNKQPFSFTITFSVSLLFLFSFFNLVIKCNRSIIYDTDAGFKD